MAHLVGPAGRLVAVEVDEALAAVARANLASMAWVDVRHGDGSGGIDETFDAILVNAGVTHPLEAWLDALPAGGRLALPLTVAMQDTIGKGVMLLVTRDGDASFAIKPLGIVAIYSAVGLRDAALNAALGDAMRRQPWPAATRLRRDAHEPTTACWFHAEGWCLDRAES
jgi:protein-L-isoaspartate(D-aspartate) O-methyltransferase